MRVCVPVTHDGQVDPRWGRASRVAVADVRAGAVTGWQVFDEGEYASHLAGRQGNH